MIVQKIIIFKKPGKIILFIYCRHCVLHKMPTFFVVHFVLHCVYPCPLIIDEFNAEVYLKEVCRSLCTSVIDINFFLHTANWYPVYNRFITSLFIHNLSLSTIFKLQL
jgi:hypothetical protein